MAFCLLDVKGDGFTLTVREAMDVGMGLSMEAGTVCGRIRLLRVPRNNRLEAGVSYSLNGFRAHCRCSVNTGRLKPKGVL